VILLDFLENHILLPMQLAGVKGLQRTGMLTE